MKDQENPYNWRRIGRKQYRSPRGRFMAYVGQEGVVTLHDTDTGEVTVHYNLKWAEHHAMDAPGPKDCELCLKCESFRRKTKCATCVPGKYDWQLSEYKECQTEFVRASSGGGFYRLRRRP